MEATERQKAFLKHLEQQHPYAFAKALRSLKLDSAENLSKAQASALIGTILAGARVTKLPPVVPEGAKPWRSYAHKSMRVFSRGWYDATDVDAGRLASKLVGNKLRKKQKPRKR